jgi:hypothetical protein
VQPLAVLFSAGAAEVFRELPAAVQRRAERSIVWAWVYPKMFGVRRRGLMQGYRYFAVEGYLFYYSFTSDEPRTSAILPGRMAPA